MLKGKDHGKRGKVVHVDPRARKLTVEGLNLLKRHMRPRRQGEKGETVSVPRAIHSANAMLICPHCGKATRVGARTEGEHKARYCKKCNAAL